MKRDIRELPLELIKLDQTNVRFGGDIAESQIEALQLLMNDTKDARKLYNLAKDISENGLDPTDIQMVFPDGKGSYIVMEGNRRLAALKLLVKPDLCPIENRVKDFISLQKNAKFKVPKKIQFSFIESREAGYKWTSLKHTGENDGIGRVGWDGDIRDEYKARSSGVESIGRQLRNLISTNTKDFDLESKKNCEIIAVTNLTRLFQSTPAQNFFHLKVESKKLKLNHDLKYIAPSVSFALKLMADKNFTVNDIRDSENRIKFIHKIPAELNPLTLLQHTGNDQNSSSNSTKHSDSDHPKFDNESNEGANNSGYSREHEENQNNSGLGASNYSGEDGNIRRARAKPDRKLRSRLIDWPMRIEPPRINDLFRDLRNKLNVQETPGSVAVVFRVFLEVSCDHYIRSCHDAGNPVVTANQQQQPVYGNQIKLAMKVQAVSKHLEIHKKLTPDEGKAIRKRADAPDTMGSIDHLNQFVHGYSVMAIPADLNAIADEYKPLLEKIWG